MLLAWRAFAVIAWAMTLASCGAVAGVERAHGSFAIDGRDGPSSSSSSSSFLVDTLERGVNDAPPHECPSSNVEDKPANASDAGLFPIGPGFSDVIPHQILRARNDRVYVFSALPYQAVIVVYSTSVSGLPSSQGDFVSRTKVATAGVPLSIDAAYDGRSTVHVLAVTTNGLVVDYPFDIGSETFSDELELGRDGPVVSGDYMGTSGISAQVDRDCILHVAGWSGGNHITYAAYSYNEGSNRLIEAMPKEQLHEGLGDANHPALAISPVDGSLIVAWVAENGSRGGEILARRRDEHGTWGPVSQVSSAVAWTSSQTGVNIDQGPSLVIDGLGTAHLSYIQSWDSSGDYGRVRYARSNGHDWQDVVLDMYSHDPALALGEAGELYILGHGHSLNASCRNPADLCILRRIGDSWEGPRILAIAPFGFSFDSSVSVKWSIVGFNRPNVTEFVFFSTPYQRPTLYYGRLGPWDAN